MINLEFMHSLKTRALLVWISDLALSIFAYYYLTSPKKILELIQKASQASSAQLAAQGYDVNTLASPEYIEVMTVTIKNLVMGTLVTLVVMHTFTFIKYAREVRMATTYVKYYCATAAPIIFIWFAFNPQKSNIWILLPFAVFTLVAIYEFENS